MGLYDELLTEEQHLRCPGCGEKIDSLQTKSLPDPALTQYRIGDEIKVATREGLAFLVIEEGQIVGSSSCRVCGVWSDWHAVIREKRWVRTELMGWRPPTRRLAPRVLN